MNEDGRVVGYKRPPRSTRFAKGVSGNPKGRPKARMAGLPYAEILDRMVTIREGTRSYQVTAEAAFLRYLRKKALDGVEAAQEQVEEIQAFRRAHDSRLNSGPVTCLCRKFNSSGVGPRIGRCLAAWWTSSS